MLQLPLELGGVLSPFLLPDPPVWGGCSGLKASFQQPLPGLGWQVGSPAAEHVHFYVTRGPSLVSSEVVPTPRSAPGRWDLVMEVTSQCQDALLAPGPPHTLLQLL